MAYDSKQKQEPAQRPQQRDDGDGARWLNLNGAPVKMDDAGNILQACPGLEGYNVDELDETRGEREAKMDAAEGDGWMGSEAQRAADTWRQAQGEVPDGTIVVVRTGDTFRLFGADAKTVGPLINAGDGQMIELDEETFDGHLQEIIGNGHRVAIVEQNEDGAVESSDHPGDQVGENAQPDPWDEPTPGADIAGAAEQAPGGIGRLIRNMLETRDVRKQGRGEAELEDDYAKQIYEEIQTLGAKGDGFGDAYDLSDHVARAGGAVGYHSPAGMLMVSPPAIAGEGWQVRFSTPDGQSPQGQPLQPAASDPQASPPAEPQSQLEPQTAPQAPQGPTYGAGGGALKKAITEAVGDDATDQEMMVDLVKKHWSVALERQSSELAAIRELVSGYEGDNGQSSFTREIRNAQDPDQIRGFDEMVRTAQDRFPQLLQTGERFGAADPEYVLFEKLKSGRQQRALPQHHPQFIDAALQEMAQMEAAHASGEWIQEGELVYAGPSDFDDDLARIPFSRGTRWRIRYAMHRKRYARELAEDSHVVRYGRQGRLFTDDEKGGWKNVGGGTKQGRLFETGIWKDGRREADANRDPDGKFAEQEGRESKDPTAPKPSKGGAESEPAPENESPRERSEREARKLDEDYDYARASTVPNRGEDLKGSARHKVNEWRTLEDAESEGTAEQLVTRKHLEKNEPHNLLAIADENDNHLAAMALHFALQGFPAKPGYGKHYKPEPEEAKEDRRKYVEAWRDLKAKAEAIAATESGAKEATLEFRKAVSEKIDALRKETRFCPVANSMVTWANKNLAWSHWGKSSTASVKGKLNSFLSAFSATYVKDKETGDDLAAKMAAHAGDIIEGQTVAKSFNQQRGQNDGPARFKATDLYINAKAIREGGRDLTTETADANRAVDYMIDKQGFRGVQWGNSVTDDERTHHGKKAVEAMADLMDVCGLSDADASLGGTLGLAIGARGKGRALAHYEPDSKVINLTRKKGVGSLAHEWGHAWDNYVAGGGQAGPQVGSFLSRKGAHYYGADEDRTPIQKAMKGWTDALDSSGYAQRLNENIGHMMKQGLLSEGMASYYRQEVEVFARTFERWTAWKLRSQGRRNSYLVGLRKEADDSIYPNDSECGQLDPYFTAMFKVFVERSRKDD